MPLKVINKAKKILFEIENEAGHLKRADQGLSSGAGPVDGPTQLNLFQSADSAILNELRGMDISTTTPLEALTLLSELQEKAKKTKT